MSTGPSAHSLFGGSSAHRWCKCPASIHRSSLAPRSPSSPAAQEGTAAHTLGEICLRDDVQPESYLGRTIEGVKVTDNMIEAVQIYVDFITQLGKDNKPLELKLEEKVVLSSVDDRLYGTADATFADDVGASILVDYKHGSGMVVEVDNNYQLAFYGLGLARKFDSDGCHVYIVQPRVDHKDGPIRSWYISREELDKYEAEFKEAVVEADKGEKASAEAGSWCKWCPAAGNCPEYRASSLDEPLREALQITGDQITLPAPHTMPHDMVSDVLAILPRLESWAKDMRSYAMNTLLEGGDIRDHKVVEGRPGPRKWSDDQAVAAAASKAHIPFEKLYEEKVMSPTQLEKKLGKDVYTDHFAEFVTRADGKPKLVTTEDAGEPIKTRIEARSAEAATIFGEE